MTDIERLMKNLRRLSGFLTEERGRRDSDMSSVDFAIGATNLLIAHLEKSPEVVTAIASTVMWSSAVMAAVSLAEHDQLIVPAEAEAYVQSWLHSYLDTPEDWFT